MKLTGLLDEVRSGRNLLLSDGIQADKNQLIHPIPFALCSEDFVSSHRVRGSLSNHISNFYDLVDIIEYFTFI